MTKLNVNAGITFWCYRCKVEKPFKGGSKKNGLFCCTDCKTKPNKTESKPNV